MKILFVAAEVAPYVSVGGLSQVMYFLPRALSKLGHDVRVFTPKYGTMDKKTPEGRVWNLSMDYEGLNVPIEHNTPPLTNITPQESLICNVKYFRPRKPNPMTYFLENREYYELRANVFGYKDDHIRFALLSKGCLEWLLQKKKLAEKSERETDLWCPDVIQCNDWHTGYLLEMAREDKRYQEIFTRTPTILTVHNFAYQGNSDFRYIKDEEKDTCTRSLAPLTSPKLQKQNALARGLLYADAINTVSPTHAVEVLTPEYSEGLDTILEKVRGKLIGILNGIDTKEFNPATDTIIKVRYNEKTYVTARKENKRDLQKSFLLPEDPNKILLAISGRLSRQKGWDILLDTLPHLFEHRQDVQLVALGGGDDGYRTRLKQLHDRYPDRIGLHLHSDFRIPRKFFAGADIFLIPSVHEPGGIVALEALRYGAVPLVRRTGGLSDIIQDFNPATKKGNGFSFTQKDPWSLYGTLIEAITTYRQPNLWKKLVYNCMSVDSSWDHAAKKYDVWFKQVIEERKRATSLLPHPAYTPVTVV